MDGMLLFKKLIPMPLMALIVERYGELLYKRADKDSQGWRRGDVVVGERVIKAYPHIPRVLSPYGVVKNVPSAVAEEKKDGYNVRVALIGGKVYAFLRSGLVDPFATALFRRNPYVSAFLHHHPMAVLNVEVLGDTPYTRPLGRVEYYAFDVWEGSFWPVYERRRVLASFRIRQVPLLGEVEKEADVIGIMRSLEKGCKEGAVFKSPQREKAVKLVTPCSDMEQLNSAPFLFDLPTRFVEQRLFRSALMELFSLHRWEGVGELKEKIRSFVEEGKVFSEHELTVPTLWVWREIEKVLGRSKEIRIEGVSISEVEEGYRVSFRKVYRKSTAFLQAFLSGKAFVD